MQGSILLSAVLSLITLVKKTVRSEWIPTPPFNIGKPPRYVSSGSDL